MTLKQFQLYAERRAAAGPPSGNPGSHSRSGNSDETLDSSMATGSAGPRLAAAPPALAAVPDKWLRRQLVLEALPLHGTPIAVDVAVRSVRRLWRYACRFCLPTVLVCRALSIASGTEVNRLFKFRTAATGQICTIRKDMAW